MNSTTEKYSCHTIIDLLALHGIRDVVISPGSRNAPLIIAASRNKALRKTVIVDERSAAFVALGMCAANNGANPVALICTSGTALLNYAPAVAEAYYRCLPLIVISADRPAEWIDQDDSQTLRQYEALNNYVKKSYNIPAFCETDNLKWYVNRIINDAIITANSGRKSPIHLNIQIDEPLSKCINYDSINQREIVSPSTSSRLDCDFLKKNILPMLQNKKVLMIAGFQNCDGTNWITNQNNDLCESLDAFVSTHHNVAFLTESISNINSTNTINNIDRVLSEMTLEEKESLKPDIVISFGGAIVSRFIKQYIRGLKSVEHWHIGITNTTIDCFKSLTMKINLSPREFFDQLNEILETSSIELPIESNYKDLWNKIAIRAENSHNQYVTNSTWSDLRAFSIILPRLSGNLHLSNGTPIRYHQLFNYNKGVTQVNCNRGVSGIDGSTSTAIGHSLISNLKTTLITGDLSAQYDIGALSINNIPPSFKMIVMYNGGGGIFRFIDSTSQLDELEEYFATKPTLPLKELSQGYGFSFYSATCESELNEIFSTFWDNDNSPSILAIHTPAIESAQILKKYFKRNS